MYSEYGAFLSLAHIDSAVDGLFKAYLDSTLIDIARTASGDSPTYRTAVYEFRKAHLDPFSLQEGQTYLSEDEQKSCQKAFVAGGDRFNSAKDYLYWFDIRAKFWRKTPVDKLLTAIVAPADVLLRIEQAALELQSQRQWVLAQNAQADGARHQRASAVSGGSEDGPGQVLTSLLDALKKKQHAHHPASGTE